MKSSQNKNKKFLIIFLVFLGLVFFGSMVSAQTDEAFDLSGARFAGLLEMDLRLLIARIVQIILGFLGIIAVLIIMYAGFIWMTAAGDAAKVDKAKRILRNALIGIIIILASWTIVAFVIRSLTSDLTKRGIRPGSGSDLGRWGIGAGPIQSVYPEPGQRDVPIDTFIAVTFKEPINPLSICQTVNAEGNCQGSVMKNVEICQLDENYFCQSKGDFTVAAFVESKVSNSSDQRTFVFTPQKYLGQEDFQDREFMVKLLGGIERSADGKSIFEGLPGQSYQWSFITNGELDLNPPTIISTNAVLNPPGTSSVSGVYPHPDNAADTYGVGEAATVTQFNFIINDNGAINRETDSSYTQPTKAGGTIVEASLSGNYFGSASGLVTVTINAAGNQATTNWPSGMTSYTSDYTGGDLIDIGPYGLVFNLNGVAQPGNQWSFNVTSAASGDRIKIFNNEILIKTYIFGRDIQVGGTSAVTLNNLIGKIISDNSAIFASCGSGCVATRETGVNSARYQINFYLKDGDSLGTAININKTAGKDSALTRTVNDQRDVPRNTIFQINFNKAINPLSLDGHIIVRYDISNNKNPNTYQIIEGARIEFSNQYRTVELIGPEPCGFNTCGDQVYCWPVNNIIANDPDNYAAKATHYQVRIVAARLTYANDDRCASWGGIFETNNGRRCYQELTDGTRVFYPKINPETMDGIFDMSGNSFNGSFNYYFDERGRVLGLAEGQSLPTAGEGTSGRPAYVLNNSNPIYDPVTPVFGVSGYGDDFIWQFFISDEIDLQAPLISRIGPDGFRGDETSFSLIEPIEISFDRLMRGSTLRPGWNYGSTVEERVIRYLAINTLTARANPVGFWIKQVNNHDLTGGIWPQYTKALINHSRFDSFVQYAPLAGSGVESITQNCFLPSAGPAAAGSGECQYISETDLSGCVAVASPNPASFGQLNCSQISGANICAANQVCRVWHDNNLAGSWVLTKDYNRGDDGQTINGCCFGICVARP